jgi:hypothetical protein
MYADSNVRVSSRGEAAQATDSASVLLNGVLETTPYCSDVMQKSEDI